MVTTRRFLIFLGRGCLSAILLLAAFPAIRPEKLAQAAPFSRFWLLPGNESAGDFQDVSLVIDSNNGQHAVFYPARANIHGRYPAYYAYCPANCANAANWSYVDLGDDGEDGRGLAIALTPNGQPRVTWYYKSPEKLKHYFAECDANCGQPASWKSAQIWELSFTSDMGVAPDKPRHYLAVDPFGTAHIVYSDVFGSSHNGIFYASCASNCTLSTSWTDVKIVESNALAAANLRFDSAGHPRLVYFGITNTLVYMECNSNCNTSGNWTSVILNPLVDGDWPNEHPAYALEVTSTGKPRLAIYSNHILYYGICNSGCTTLANWSLTSLGLQPYYGVMVDLELDSNDRPYLSYSIDTFNLGYSTCTAGCDTGTPAWSHEVVETASQLEATNYVSPPAGCPFNSWHNGMNSSVALDTNDKPHFVYGAINSVYCGFLTITLTQGVRYASSGNGAPILDKHSYLPSIGHLW